MVARIAQRQGMPVSPATILRLVRRTQLAERATPSLLGVDEWAYRKRLDFKTILVDLRTNRPLELLPDASAATLATWLRAHPGVKVIARDRAGTFAEGATQGAPDAIQVADRFHLMQNLRTALEQILNRMVDARAERLHIGRATVSRYLKATCFPERVPYPRLESKLDPYGAYLTERWAAGETNGRHLWQELQSQGFRGSRMAVMRGRNASKCSLHRP